MNVLVTGGAGYIGSHTVRELVRRKHRVVVLDNLSRGHGPAVSGARLVRGDICDRELLGELLAREKIEAVLHFAASSLVGESVRFPSEYYNNNVVKGLSLFDTLAGAGVRSLVFSSTAAVYGEPREIPIPEEHATDPTNPLRATKLALRALRWYGEAYGMRWISLRYFNAAGADPAGTSGGSRSETHLIPLVLKVALGHKPHLDVFGSDYPTPDGTCVRDYIHVNDLAVAHILALEALAAGLLPQSTTWERKRLFRPGGNPGRRSSDGQARPGTPRRGGPGPAALVAGAAK